MRDQSVDATKICDHPAFKVIERIQETPALQALLQNFQVS
jgi:hypothetical protein